MTRVVPERCGSSGATIPSRSTLGAEHPELPALGFAPRDQIAQLLATMLVRGVRGAQRSRTHRSQDPRCDRRKGPPARLPPLRGFAPEKDIPARTRPEA